MLRQTLRTGLEPARTEIAAWAGSAPAEPWPAALPHSDTQADGWEQLTTVRLVLAAAVVIHHAVAMFAAPFGYVSPAVNTALSVMGECAVFFFFLVSGLVIGRSLSRSRGSGDRLFVSFMARRWRRIYPPLLGSIVLTVVCALILIAAGREVYHGPATQVMQPRFAYLENWRDVATALATFGFRGYLHGATNGPLWSLPLEMQAYVFAALTAQAICARSRWLRIASVAGIVLAIALRDRPWPYPEEAFCMLWFAAGVMLSFRAIRFAPLLPVVRLDFSYSLYILHYPLMLLVFFLACQGDPPSAPVIWALALGASAAGVALAVASGLWIEPLGLRARRDVVAAPDAGIIPPLAPLPGACRADGG